MQNQLKIISISGLDGSGKTTQIQMLKNYLEKKGEKVFYFHAIQFSVANKFNDFLKKVRSILNLSKKKKSSKKSEENFENNLKNDNGDSVTKSNWFLIQLRKVFLLIDIFRFKKLVKKLKKQNFNYLVTDRYFYDSIVNIEFLNFKLFSFCKSCKKGTAISYLKKDFENEDKINFTANTQTCLVIRLIEKIIPRPDTAFYLSISPVEIVKRDRVPEQGLNYLKIKNEILNHNFEKWNLKKILGNFSKEEVFDNLKNNLDLI
jgi:thymidylate kinase